MSNAGGQILKQVLHDRPQNERASNQSRSRNPRQGAQRTAPGRRPLPGAWLKALLLWTEPCGSFLAVFAESRFLTLTRRSNCQILGETAMRSHTLAKEVSSRTKEKNRRETNGRLASRVHSNLPVA